MLSLWQLPNSFSTGRRRAVLALTVVILGCLAAVADAGGVPAAAIAAGIAFAVVPMRLAVVTTLRPREAKNAREKVRIASASSRAG